MPKFWSVLFIMLRLALISPTPGLPRSPSRIESGIGTKGKRLADFLVRNAKFPSSAPACLRDDIPFIFGGISSDSSLGVSAPASSSEPPSSMREESFSARGVFSPPPASFLPEINFCQRILKGRRVRGLSNMTKSEITMVAKRNISEASLSKSRTRGKEIHLPTTPPLSSESILITPKLERKKAIAPIARAMENFFPKDLKDEMPRIAKRKGRTKYPIPIKYFKTV